MRKRWKLLIASLGGFGVIALAASAGAVTYDDKSQDRLFDRGVASLTVCDAAADPVCPTVSTGELREHGVRYSTVVIVNADQERTTLLRVRDAI